MLLELARWRAARRRPAHGPRSRAHDGHVGGTGDPPRFDLRRAASSASSSRATDSGRSSASHSRRPQEARASTRRPTWGTPPCIAAALSVGRPLRDDDYPDGILALREEILEIASIRGSKTFADAVDVLWRDAPARSRRAKAAASADEAASDLRKLVRKELGISTCRDGAAGVLPAGGGGG